MSTQKNEPAPHHQDRPTNHHTTQKFIAESTARRRDAVARTQPLDCGCRDPWTCRCDQSEPTQRQTEAAILAAHHLLQHGMNPLFSINQGRALWRAGHRNLAVMCVQQVSA